MSNIQWHMKMQSEAVAESMRGIPPGECIVYGRVTEVTPMEDGDFSVTYLVEAVEEN